MRTRFSLITSVLLLCVSMALADERDKLPFKWDSRFASPGTSLSLVEKERMRSPQGMLVMYELKASGFPQDQPLVLWSNFGGEYFPQPATVNEVGLVSVGQLPNGLGMMGPVRGQAFDIALAVPGSDLHAQAKVIPLPIEARGESGCAAAAELVSRHGDLFEITFSGFAPGESVETTSAFKKELLKGTQAATEKGEVVIVVMHSRRGGTASATAKGSNCTVTLQFAVGRNALMAQ